MTATATPTDESDQHEQEPSEETLPPIPVTGIISGLAQIIPTGATLLIAIARTEDTKLLLTVQPPRGKDETGATVLPVQITGSAEDIDTNLVDALTAYLPARRMALRSATEVAAATRAATATAAADAKKRQATRTTAKTAPEVKTPKGSLCVKATPENATITVTSSALKQPRDVDSGDITPLEPGTYVVTGTLDGYQNKSMTVAISNDAREIDLVLEANAPDLFAAAAEAER